MLDITFEATYCCYVLAFNLHDFYCGAEFNLWNIMTRPHASIALLAVHRFQHEGIQVPRVQQITCGTVLDGFNLLMYTPSFKSVKIFQVLHISFITDNRCYC